MRAGHSDRPQRRVERRDRGAARVGEVEPAADVDDPAGRRLARAGLGDRVQRAAAVDPERRDRVGAGLGDRQVPARVEVDRERHRAVEHGRRRAQREAAEPVDVERLDGVGVRLGGDEQVVAVRRERDLARRMGELRRGRGVEAECAMPESDRNEEAADPRVALHGPAAARVEDVDEVAVDGDAGREVAEGRQYLAAHEPVAVDPEHRDRVAAGVHGVQQTVIELQRALRGDMVDDRAVEDAAEAAGAVAAGLRQAAVRRPVVGDDRVARRIVGLDEHGGALRMGGRGAREQRGGRERGEGRTRETNEFRHDRARPATAASISRIGGRFSGS